VSWTANSLEQMPDTFELRAAVHEYAKAHGLAYVWEGTAEFQERLRTMSPDQYEIAAVHTGRGIIQVMLFSAEKPRGSA
jgi:hypothetical protein